MLALGRSARGAEQEVQAAGERQLAVRWTYLNHPCSTPPSNKISSSNFGQFTSTVATERQLQLALKLPLLGELTTNRKSDLTA